MSATHHKIEHAMKRIVKIAYNAQDDEDLSPCEVSDLDDLIHRAMEIAGADEETISQFIDGV